MAEPTLRLTSSTRAGKAHILGPSRHRIKRTFCGLSPTEDWWEWNDHRDYILDGHDGVCQRCNAGVRLALTKGLIPRKGEEGR